MIKACAFDFDGTLVDSTESIWREYQEVIDEMGLRKITYQEFTSQLGKPWDNILTTLWPGIDVGEFSRIYQQEKEETRILSHVTETLEILGKKYRLALLTSRGGKTLYRILESSGITAGAFEVILDRDTLKNHKPDPDALNQLLDKMKLEASEIVYVGDALVDAECAKNAKVTFIGVLTGGATRDEFAELGVKHVIENLEELPAALERL